MKVIFSRFLCFVFFVILIPINTLSASALLIEELMHLESLNNKDMQRPSPISLHPQWWNYFDVEGEELNQRIAATNESLQKLYVLLPYEDQNVALNYINKISTTLNALPYARKLDVLSPAENRPFLNVYTLEKQLELNKQLRKLNDELKIEADRFENLKERLAKTQSHLDNLMVTYLSQTEPSMPKLMNGLEIMMYGANTAMGEQNVRAAQSRFETLTARIQRLEEELEFSKYHLDVHEFDEGALEKNISFLMLEVEKSQKELATKEAHLLGSFSSLADHSKQLFLEQQLLHAHVNRAYGWANLTFHTLKFNIIMLINNRFHKGLDELRKNLTIWDEQVEEVKQQTLKWYGTSLREQERIRQEYATLLARNESAESKAMQDNQFQMLEILNLLSTLELLKDTVGDIEWLVSVLDIHFRSTSTIFENWGLAIAGFFSKLWHSTVHVMNFSIFKISGIPITLFSILKLLMIYAGSFWVSLRVRSTIIKFGKKSKEFNESSLHVIGLLARYSIIMFGVILSLWVIGIDFSHLVFIMGALLFGISFGFQSIANNIFCGLRILFERKLELGDDIELHSGHHGKVEEIHIQNTIVYTQDGQKVIVPNSEIIGNTLINWTRKHVDHRRLHIPFTVAAENDKELIREIVIEAAKKVPCTLKNNLEYSEPQVWLLSFDHHSMQFELVVWVDYKGDACTDSKESDFLWEIETALREHHIALPISLHDLLAHQVESAAHGKKTEKHSAKAGFAHIDAKPSHG